MKYLLLFSTVVFFSFLIKPISKLSGQTQLSGIVTEASSGDPMLFCTVVIYQKGTLITGTETDLNGHYSFPNIAPGTYDVEASYVGYSANRKKNIVVHASKKTVINIELSEGVLADEIVMIEYKAPLIQHNKSRTNSTIAAQEIRNLPTKSIQDLSNYHAQESESYQGITENRFKTPQEEALSTFSIDVDRAAYSNVRRFINNGQLPPADAVRIEEMINYFDYEYDGPRGKDPFAVHTTLTSCPWNEENQILHIGLQGKRLETKDLPVSNLVFLVDVSGSMQSQNKLPLLKSSFKLLINQLREQDKVSIVVYAGAAGLVLEPTAGNEKQIIFNAIDKLSAGGSTAGGQGIKLAYKTAKEHFIKGGNNRVILATDGDFNVGASSDDAMESLIEKERKSGVFLSVLGYGMGNYKDSKMQILADKGNGNHAYIDNIQEAKKVFVNEFGGTLFTIAKDVKIQIEFNPANVQAYRLIGYENRLLNKEDFNDDTKDAGELGAGHVVTAMYEIVPTGVESNYIGKVDDLKYQENEKLKYEGNTSEVATVKLRYKQPDGNKSKKLVETIRKSDYTKFSKSNDVNFSMAVAEFGLLLRDSEFKGNASYSDILMKARAGKGADKDGYRSEFIRLVETVEGYGDLVSKD